MKLGKKERGKNFFMQINVNLSVPVRKNDTIIIYNTLMLLELKNASQ